MVNTRGTKRSLRCVIINAGKCRLDICGKTERQILVIIESRPPGGVRVGAHKAVGLQRANWPGYPAGRVGAARSGLLRCPIAAAATRRRDKLLAQVRRSDDDSLPACTASRIDNRSVDCSLPSHL